MHISLSFSLYNLYNALWKRKNRFLLIFCITFYRWCIRIFLTLEGCICGVNCNMLTKNLKVRIMIGGFHSYTISTIKVIILILATFGTWYPSFKFQYLQNINYIILLILEKYILYKYNVLKKTYFLSWSGFVLQTTFGL